jgi:hypothetical protein
MANEIYHRSNWGNAVNDKYWADVYEKYSATNKMYIRSDYYENSNETDKLMADIYPKPSILLTPTAYDNGSLHSVKPVQSLGSELVTNGGFDTDSNWNKTNATISNGVATVTVTGGGYSAITQSVTYVSGKKYRVTAQIQGLSGSSGKQIRFQDNGSNLGGLTLSNGIITLDETLQNIEITWTANSNSNNIVIARNGSGDYSWTIDNVSVKEVIDADFDFTRGSSATRVNEKGLIEDVQILSGNLVQNGDFEEEGSELVTNGDFDTDSDWSKYYAGDNNSITIANGVLSFDSNTNQNVQQTISSSNLSGFYKITYTITSYTRGNAHFLLGGGSNIYLGFETGTFTKYVQGGGNTNNFVIYGGIFGQGGELSIDNVSVKEVGQNWSSYDGNVIFKQGSVQIDTNGAAYTEFRAGNDFNSPDAILTIGNKYRLTYTISESNSGGIKTNSLIANDTILTSTVGTHTIEGLANLTSLGILRNGDTDITIDNISVIEITDDTDLPRIDYTDGTGSLLLEPQSTNLFSYSQDFTNSYWLKSANVTVTNSSELSPNGELDAYLIEYDGGGFSFIRVNRGSTNTTSTLSVFAKKGNWRYLGFRNFQTSGNDHTVFDFDTETFSNIASVQNASFEIFPNGWYRIKVNQPSPSSNPYLGFALTNSTGTESNPTGGQVANVHLFGAQTEELSYATSYIPTSGSTVTRLADVCNNAGSSDLINSTEGVLYAEIAALGNQGTAREITINDGTTNNRVIISYNVYNQIRINYRNSSSNIFDQLINSTITDFHKIAVKWKVNDFSFYLDGNEIASSSSGSVIPANTLTTLSFDDGGGGYNFEGKVKTVAVFKEALTDEQLQKLTQV